MGGYSQGTVRVPHTVHTYSAWHGIYIHVVPVRTYLLLVLYCSATATPVRYYFTVRLPISYSLFLTPLSFPGSRLLAAAGGVEKDQDDEYVFL